MTGLLELEGQDLASVGAFDHFELIELLKLSLKVPPPEAARPPFAARKFAAGNSHVNAFPVDPDNGQAVDVENPSARHTVLPLFSTRSRGGFSHKDNALAKRLSTNGGDNLS